MRLLLFFFFTVQVTVAFSQTSVSKPLYIKYEMLFSDGSGFNELEQWFTSDYTMYKLIYPEVKMSQIPVNIDGKVIITSDTLKYAKEFKEFNEQVTKDERKGFRPLNFRKYSSNILFTNVGDFDKKKYCVADTLKNMTDWEILADTFRVLGFTCQKAMTNFYGSIFTAYFTMQLPYTGGPKNFRGLPGVILKVENHKKTFGYIATEIIYPFKEQQPSAKVEGKLISNSEFDKIVEKDNQRNMQELGNLQKGIMPSKTN